MDNVVCGFKSISKNIDNRDDRSVMSDTIVFVQVQAANQIINNTSNNIDYTNMVDSIFEMTEEEISYPILVL
jgi:deoxyadenosine/deoxycytidine kinase